MATKSTLMKACLLFILKLSNDSDNTISLVFSMLFLKRVKCWLFSTGRKPSMLSEHSHSGKFFNDHNWRRLGRKSSSTRLSMMWRQLSSNFNEEFCYGTHINSAGKECLTVVRPLRIILLVVYYHVLPWYLKAEAWCLIVRHVDSALFWPKSSQS